MADRTVRAIFEAKVSGARRGMTDLAKDVTGAGKKVDTLAKDLKALDAQKVAPTIDVKIDEAKKRLNAIQLELSDLKKLDASPEVTAKIDEFKKRRAEVRKEIQELEGQKVEVKINASIKDAQKKVNDIEAQLGELRTMEVTPEVTANIKTAQRDLRDAKASLRELNAAKATMKVTADTGAAKKDIDDLADDVADAGAEGGDEAGENIVQGILGALQTIPIAGAVIGVGVAIAGGLLLGIQQGLAIEAERDLFGAQTGLDEATSARFGRAAGEAYANAWGDSVAANLDTARRAMQAGIIDSEATDREIENVIAKLQGLSDLFEFDIAMAVQGVGNLMKTGLVRDADEAFDLIVAAQQKLPSDDLLETLNEYSNQFATIGLEGEAAFGLIVQGAEAGARDTDKVADSLKELGLRIREGLDPARDALAALDLDVEDTIAAFQEGGPRAAEAIDRVFDALRVLKAEGGNTQEVIAALFGGPGEDLGAALFALDVSEAAAALGGMEGAAGAADRALQTMTDNTATRMEEAKRNVEIAMDGIKGALAEAFGDEIDSAADWVTRNRAPIIQFFLDVFNGAIEAGKGFAEFSASALEAIADVAEGMASLVDALPGGNDLANSLRDVSENARDSAESVRTEIPAALDEVAEKANRWAAPELLKARVHDATVAMAQDMRDLEEEVGTTEFAVTINGDTLNAEEALAVLTENIDASDGTVRINGDKVPAEDAVDRLMELIEDSEGDVTVGGDVDPARDRVGNLMKYIGGQSASVKVRADTSSANATLNLFLRDRTMRVRVVTDTSRSTIGGLARHDGGWIGAPTLPGLYAGGRVPGSDPGYDNVLWPLNMGGRTLMQPLAGGEYVVNSRAAGENAALLEFLNAGGKLGQGGISEDHSAHFHGNVYARDLNAAVRQARKYQDSRYNATRKGP